MSEHLEADLLDEEADALAERIEDLEIFICGPNYKELLAEECDDLTEQLYHMRAYHRVLWRRVQRERAR